MLYEGEAGAIIYWTVKQSLATGNSLPILYVSFLSSVQFKQEWWSSRGNI
jgi:hypothetical protein